MSAGRPGSYCPNCGVVRGRKAKFCVGCGFQFASGRTSELSGAAPNLTVETAKQPRKWLRRVVLGSVAVLAAMIIAGLLTSDPNDSSNDPTERAPGLATDTASRTSTSIAASMLVATQTVVHTATDTAIIAATLTTIPTAAAAADTAAAEPTVTMPNDGDADPQQAFDSIGSSRSTSTRAPSETSDQAETPTPQPSPTLAPTSTPTATNTPRPPATALPSSTAIPTDPAAPTVQTLPTATEEIQLALTCERFDAWIWAQTVLERDPLLHANTLDPDGDGIACPQLMTVLGFAPAAWVDQLPADVVTAQIVSVVDGDTLDLTIEGQLETVRIYRADTPEIGTTPECGGGDARSFAIWALSFNDLGQTVFLQKDRTSRDQYGRYLAYVWFTVDGAPYLLNELMIRSGFANDVDYGDRLFDDQMRDAVEFASRHGLGVWSICGGFSPEQLAVSQPVAPVAIPTSTTGTSMGIASGCDPNYTPCVENVTYDLDCGDIGFEVHVVGTDRHRLDRDGDGRGCESY